MVGVAVAGLAGSMIASNASQNAADTQANAENNAANMMQNQYNLSRQDIQPWLDSGRNALSQLNQQLPNLTRSFSLADFQQDPGYQFNLQQGQQAIARSAAARGLGDSTAALKDTATFSQGLAANQYQNAFNNFNTNQANTFNRLATMAGMGQQAATTNGAQGLQSAANIGQDLTGAANAQAAGTVGTANAINSAIGTGTNAWMQQQMLNRLAPTQAAGSFSMGGNYGASPTNGYANALGTYNF
jgi:hypothetical protein